ncbi:hypothetical protein, partial [Mycobacterium marinum]|uniref:hypothetical protein n=1 Tax=Mycobacterium marinum TaxID=1781 RepID=UPI0021C380AA
RWAWGDAAVLVPLGVRRLRGPVPRRPAAVVQQPPAAAVALLAPSVPVEPQVAPEMPVAAHR